MSDRALVGGVVRFVGARTVTRLTADGAPDPTFAKTTLPTWAERLHLDASGRIVVEHDGLQGWPTRVLPDGGIDTAYATAARCKRTPTRTRWQSRSMRSAACC